MPLSLITGATGFIGCRLSELWQSEGRYIRATGLVRNEVEKERAAALCRSGVDFVINDLTTSGDIDAVLDDVDTVVHLAAAQHEANVSEDYFHKINVDATRKLVLQCDKRGVRRFFYASSIGVYGGHDKGEIDQHTPLVPDNPYARSKVAAEAMLGDYDGDVNVYIGRIGETYGPWDMRLHKLYAGIEKGRFWLIGPCQNLHQPIYVDDLVIAIDKLIETPGASGKSIILCGEHAITTGEICTSIAESLGVTLSRWSVPLWPLLIAAVGMEITLGNIGIQPPLHRRRLDFFRKSLTFSTSARDHPLTMPAQLSFEEGARRAANWYRKNHWL